MEEIFSRLVNLHDIFILLTGEKQTGSPRLTLHDSGDLSIKNVTFSDAGKFTCIVHNTRFLDSVVHDVKITSEFLSVTSIHFIVQYFLKSLSNFILLKISIFKYTDKENGKIIK